MIRLDKMFKKISISIIIMFFIIVLAFTEASAQNNGLMNKRESNRFKYSVGLSSYIGFTHLRGETDNGFSFLFNGDFLRLSNNVYIGFLFYHFKIVTHVNPSDKKGSTSVTAVGPQIKFRFLKKTNVQMFFQVGINYVHYFCKSYFFLSDNRLTLVAANSDVLGNDFLIGSNYFFSDKVSVSITALLHVDVNFVFPNSYSGIYIGSMYSFK